MEKMTSGVIRTISRRGFTFYLIPTLEIRKYDLREDDHNHQEIKYYLEVNVHIFFWDIWLYYRKRRK